MGQAAPLEHFVQVVFDYRNPYPRDMLFPRIAEVPLDVWLVIMLPVAVQGITVAMLTIATARFLSAISRGAAFTARARRSLTLLGVVGVAGGLVRFGVGVLAWQVGRAWLDLDQDVPRVWLYGAELPFPGWSITLVIIGLLAAALSVALRAGAQLEEDLEGVV